MGIDVKFDGENGSLTGSVQMWIMLLIVAAVIGIGFYLGTQLGHKVA